MLWGIGTHCGSNEVYSISNYSIKGMLLPEMLIDLSLFSPGNNNNNNNSNNNLLTSRSRVTLGDAHMRIATTGHLVLPSNLPRENLRPTQLNQQSWPGSERASWQRFVVQDTLMSNCLWIVSSGTILPPPPPLAPAPPRHAPRNPHLFNSHLNLPHNPKPWKWIWGAFQTKTGDTCRHFHWSALVSMGV